MKVTSSYSEIQDSDLHLRTPPLPYRHLTHSLSLLFLILVIISSDLLPGTKKFDACNHVRAYQYYSESMVKSQGFVGFPCSDKGSFDAVSLLLN